MSWGSSRARTIGLVAALVAASALAGCVDDGGSSKRIEAFPPLPDQPLRDFSVEQIHLFVESEDAYRVGVPLPVSGNVTTAADWARNVSLTAHGEDPSVELRDTEHGPVLVLEGSNSATVRSVVIEVPQQGNRCCAEAFLDARWSTADGDGNARVWIPDGTVAVDLEYEAEANFCSASATLEEEGLTGGWVTVESQLGGGECQ